MTFTSEMSSSDNSSARVPPVETATVPSSGQLVDRSVTTNSEADPEKQEPSALAHVGLHTSHWGCGDCAGESRAMRNATTPQSRPPNGQRARDVRAWRCRGRGIGRSFGVAATAMHAGRTKRVAVICGPLVVLHSVGSCGCASHVAPLLLLARSLVHQPIDERSHVWASVVTARGARSARPRARERRRHAASPRCLTMAAPAPRRARDDEQALHRTAPASTEVASHLQVNG